jgi:hypothetical protein
MRNAILVFRELISFVDLEYLTDVFRFMVIFQNPSETGGTSVITFY